MGSGSGSIPMGLATAAAVCTMVTDAERKSVASSGKIPIWSDDDGTSTVMQSIGFTGPFTVRIA